MIGKHIRIQLRGSSLPGIMCVSSTSFSDQYTFNLGISFFSWVLVVSILKLFKSRWWTNVDFLIRPTLGIRTKPNLTVCNVHNNHFRRSILLVLLILPFSSYLLERMSINLKLNLLQQLLQIYHPK